MASARQVILGKLIDTALAAPDRPFERRPRFIDDAAASDYMYRLQKLGKKAMDRELHDATYGEEALTPQQRIALAKMETRAWKGDPKAQHAMLLHMASIGNPHAKKALAALKKAGEISGDAMGLSFGTAFKYATAPVWAPAYGIYKGAQWTGKKMGIGTGQSAEGRRLAMMKAAAKRRQAAEARAAAADAETAAEQRAQNALADAADAEADAADAQALAKEAAMKTKEVEADPSQASPSSDEAGWGFHVPGLSSLKKGLSRGLHAAEAVAKAPLGLMSRFIPGRDARKAALVRNTYKKLWYEHANWLAIQDKLAGNPIQSRAKYEYVAKLWAKAQLKANKLPTSFIAPTVSAGEAAMRADVLRHAIMGDAMGSWFWPFGAFLNLSRTTINNTTGQRADAPLDEQQSQAVPPDFQDLSNVQAPQQDAGQYVPPDDGSGSLIKKAMRGDTTAAGKLRDLREREALDGELMGL